MSQNHVPNVTWLHLQLIIYLQLIFNRILRPSKHLSLQQCKPSLFWIRNSQTGKPADLHLTLNFSRKFKMCVKVRPLHHQLQMKHFATLFQNVLTRPTGIAKLNMLNAWCVDILTFMNKKKKKEVCFVLFCLSNLFHIC